MNLFGKTALSALLTLWSGLALGLCAQDITGRIDSLRHAYDFPAAVDLCLRSLRGLNDSIPADSLLRVRLNEQIVLSKNGESMMDYCVIPSVVARQRFSADEFLLYFPVENHSWLSCPNPLDTLGGDIWAKAIYMPGSLDSKVYFSAPDTLGVRNIYFTERQDSTWAPRTLASQEITSGGDEIYPLPDQDGRALYFASRGHYGLGGFDLYVSEWSDADGSWTAPVNLGLPYSSPFDDFLYYNTPDGRYTVFASNRLCHQSDSVDLFVLEYEPLPVHVKVDDPQRLAELASLSPNEENSKIDNSTVIDNSILDNPQTDMYVRKVAEVRALRDDINAHKRALEELRQRYESLPTNDLRDEILEKEMQLPRKQADLDRAISELQKIEMDFLMSGVVIDIDKVKEDSKKDVVGAASGFTFTKNEYICE